MLLTAIQGNFNANDIITGATSGAIGHLASFDGDRQILKVKDQSQNFILGEKVTSTSSGLATITRLDIASATVDVVSVADTDGKFLNEDGYVSEATMKVQDSKYYQDFSYVLKVGQSINDWRDAFKKTMHTAGFYFTGQVDIESRITVTAKGPVTGVVSGVEETPLLSIVNTLFTTVFGRRLGTNSDGSTLRVGANLGVNVDVSNTFEDPFAAGTRDVTATREDISLNYLSRSRNNITDGSGTIHDIRSGYAYGGPRYGSLNKYANTIFGNTNSGSAANSFQNLSNLKIEGTKTALDGSAVPIFLLTSNEVGKRLRMKYAFPCEVASNKDLFSNTISNNLMFIS